MKRLLLVLLAAAPCWGAISADEIVRRSVAGTLADWAASPHYSFTEKDVTGSGGSLTTKTYRVMMIAGSPYNKLIAMNGEPLSPKQAAEQDRKLQAEIERRNHETSREREKRVSAYENERRQDHALLREMANAFTYRLDGEETVNGRKCYVLDAEPKPGYRPPDRDTKVLTGMRGKMWVDEQQFRWAKVHAEVFRPVTYGLFIARVRPGTEFSLEERPLPSGIWLPSHFSVKVRARILILSRNSTDDETYTNYRPAIADAALAHRAPSAGSQR